MNHLSLHEFHKALNARTIELHGLEVVAHYGDPLAEYRALRERVGILDLSFRGRICVAGADRVRFIHGQVTNDIKRLRPGEGCYAALTDAKGKMRSDATIYCLRDELLLDIEPGLTDAIRRRLEGYIVADDVQVVDVAPDYGLLSVQGPEAQTVLRATGLFGDLPVTPLSFRQLADPALGEIYLMNQPRLGLAGFDLFVPASALGAIADKLLAAAQASGGRACGWEAIETVRVEAGIPRFGIDMDNSHIPLECGIESRAISYSKGCYVGQEVINRIHSRGHVNRELRGIRLAEQLKVLPAKGDKLFRDGKEVGYMTSAVKSPALAGAIGLGYVRREANTLGTELTLRTAEGESIATIVELPFGK